MQLCWIDGGMDTFSLGRKKPCLTNFLSNLFDYEVSLHFTDKQLDKRNASKVSN